MPNIIETAIAANSFKTLITAIDAAGLTETLSGPGPFTVFAPNDDAFADLPKSTVEALLKDIPKLNKVLTYHVVAGKHMAGALSKIPKLKTLEGMDVTLDAHKGVQVNDSKVIKADIACDNGVIHVIDAVLIMPAARSTTK